MYQHIRDLREDADLSQRQLAQLLHISQATYSRYERGVLDIPSEVLIQLAQFYRRPDTAQTKEGHATDLLTSSPVSLARDNATLGALVPLQVFGCYCGTDGRHLEQLTRVVGT